MQLISADGVGALELAERLARQPDVEYAVVDGRQRALVAPNDPLYADGQTTFTPAAGQWYLRAPDATRVAAINAEAAWTITTGKPGVVVAVLDTGVRADHPDFAGKLLPGYDFISDAPTAADGDARDNDPSDPGDFVTPDDVSGPNAVSGCSSADIGNSSWHGTETAGLIGAATNNGSGMASVGRNVMLLPVRVLGKCGGYDSDIQAAMLWAAGLPVAGIPTNPNPAKVVNLSLGSGGVCNSAYQDVVNQLTAAGVVVVAAAGNDGLAVGTPANCTGVIAVAGLRHAGTKVGFSDLGSAVALSAPAGNCVNPTGDCQYPLITTTNAGATAPVAYGGVGVYSTGGANASLGTSFSAPLVAGAAALMFSANAALTPAQVLAKLQATARPFPTTSNDPSVTFCSAPTSVAQISECLCTTSTCGAGMLDAGQAVLAVASVVANIGVASTAVAVGDPITLDGSGSGAHLSGQTIQTYQWAITRGADIAGFTSATNASTATLVISASGIVEVSLTVTDSAARQDTTSTVLSAGTATPSNPPPLPAVGGGGDGGGAIGWVGLLAGLAALFALLVVAPRRAPP